MSVNNELSSVEIPQCNPKKKRPRKCNIETPLLKITCGISEMDAQNEYLRRQVEELKSKIEALERTNARHAILSSGTILPEKDVTLQLMTGIPGEFPHVSGLVRGCKKEQTEESHVDKKNERATVISRRFVVLRFSIQMGMDSQIEREDKEQDMVYCSQQVTPRELGFPDGITMQITVFNEKSGISYHNSTDAEDTYPNKCIRAPFLMWDDGDLYRDSFIIPADNTEKQIRFRFKYLSINRGDPITYKIRVCPRDEDTRASHPRLSWESIPFYCYSR